MAFPYQYQGYPSYYPQPVPDQLAQLRQNQMQQPIMQGAAQIPSVGQPQTVMGTPPFPSNGVQDCDNNWVSSQDEANNWLVAPGHSVIMRDVNNRHIYVKSRDANGIPSPLRVFEDTSAAIQQDSPFATQIDMSGYVTWDKLDEYLAGHMKWPSKATQSKEEQIDG